MKFKLLRGLHHERGRTYGTGDVVETDTDLAKRFNVSGSLKFELVDDTAKPVVPVDEKAVQEAAEAGFNSGEESIQIPLHRLTLVQLRQLAEQRGVDVSDLSRKVEIIECLEEAPTT